MSLTLRDGNGACVSRIHVRGGLLFILLELSQDFLENEGRIISRAMEAAFIFLTAEASFFGIGDVLQRLCAMDVS